MENGIAPHGNAHTQWKPDSGNGYGKGASLSNGTVDGKISSHVLHDVFYHIQTHAPAGIFGNCFIGGKAGRKDKLPDFPGIVLIVRAGKQPLLPGPLPDTFLVDSFPSSLMVILSSPATLSAEKIIFPLLSLPAASRSSGDSIPWSTALRRICSSASDT